MGWEEPHTTATAGFQGESLHSKSCVGGPGSAFLHLLISLERGGTYLIRGLGENTGHAQLKSHPSGLHLPAAIFSPSVESAGPAQGWQSYREEAGFNRAHPKDGSLLLYSALH